MVRVKKRYILLDVSSNVDNFSENITGSMIYKSIKKLYQELYGDFGIACLGSFGVKYFNKVTNILIIQCNRDHHRRLLHAITMVKSVDLQPCVLSSLYLGATMKSCQKFLVNYSRKELFKALDTEMKLLP